MMIPRQGKGTGTERKKKYDLWSKDHIPCEHRCPICQIKFKHKVFPNLVCHIYFVISHLPCSTCMEWPFIENFRWDGK